LRFFPIARAGILDPEPALFIGSSLTRIASFACNEQIRVWGQSRDPADLLTRYLREAEAGLLNVTKSQPLHFFVHEERSVLQQSRRGPPFGALIALENLVLRKATSVGFTTLKACCLKNRGRHNLVASVVDGQHGCAADAHLGFAAYLLGKPECAGLCARVVNERSRNPE